MARALVVGLLIGQALVLPLAAPTAVACSLAGKNVFERAAWIDNDTLVVSTGVGVATFDLNFHSFKESFEELYVMDWALSPDGRWLLLTYTYGGLGADCSHDGEATDVIDLETGERVRVLGVGARALGGSDAGALVVSDCGGLQLYPWGDWSHPQTLKLTETRPDLGADAVQDAAISPDGHWLALATQDMVYLIHEPDGDLQWEARWPASPHDPFAFSPDNRFLAVVSAGADTSQLRTVRLDGERAKVAAARSDPAKEGGDGLTGTPAWGRTGLAIPFDHGLYLFPDPADLSRPSNWTLDGEVYIFGQVAWSPSKENLIMAEVRLADDGWSVAGAWILSADLRRASHVDANRTQLNGLPSIVKSERPGGPLMCVHERSPDTGPDARPHGLPGLAVIGATLAVVASAMLHRGRRRVP